MESPESQTARRATGCRCRFQIHARARPPERGGASGICGQEAGRVLIGRRAVGGPGVCAAAGVTAEHGALGATARLALKEEEKRELLILGETDYQFVKTITQMITDVKQH